MDYLPQDCAINIFKNAPHYLLMYSLVSKQLRAHAFAYTEQIFPSLCGASTRIKNAAMILFALYNIHKLDKKIVCEIIKLMRLPSREFDTTFLPYTLRDENAAMHHFTCACLLTSEDYSHELSMICTDKCTPISYHYDYLHNLIWSKAFSCFPEMTAILIDMCSEYSNNQMIRQFYSCGSIISFTWSADNFKHFISAKNVREIIRIHKNGCPFGGTCVKFAIDHGFIIKAKWLLTIGCRIPAAYKTYEKFILNIQEKKL
jgi:hypothetical protein